MISPLPNTLRPAAETLTGLKALEGHGGFQEDKAMLPISHMHSVPKPVFNYRFRKVGGIWFLSLGRFNISFCVSRDYRDESQR